MSEEQPEASKPRSAIVITVLSTVATLLLGYNTLQVNRFNTELTQAENDRALNFKLYDTVLAAVGSNDARQIRAARIIVEAMAEGNTREGFLSVLENGELAIYEAESVALPVVASRPKSSEPLSASGPWHDWDFDIFWCSVSGAAAEAQAGQLQQALLDDGAAGRIRVRLLPESIRQKEAGSTFGYQVRVDADEQAEIDMGGQLAQFANAKLFAGAAQGFKVEAIAQAKPTKWYISAFVCPQPSAARR